MKKTKEELAADRKAKTIAMLTGPRTAYHPEMLKPSAETAALPMSEGLELSDLQTKPIEWFKPNPANHVFNQLKTPDYWMALKRDIREACAILNPVIALPDGTLLEGHSRVQVARELRDEGFDLGRIPVLLVASPLTTEEAERRVYLGNLSRFEIDEDTRLALYAKIWPDFFLTKGSAGRPEKSGHGDPISAASIAQSIGKSEKQVKRDRATVRAAHVLAKQEGKTSPDPKHIRQMRDAENLRRRLSEEGASSTTPVRAADEALQEIVALEMKASLAAMQGGEQARINEARSSAFREAIAILKAHFTAL